MINNDILNKIYKDVEALLDSDKSGHAMDHIDRVVRLTQKFATQEKADVNRATLIALLHDVDDSKIFGEQSDRESSNAKKILGKHNLSESLQTEIIEEVKTIGYGKHLQGIHPQTLEGKIVSDADMCDAIGSMGILRAHQFTIHRGIVFFDKTIPPRITDEIPIDDYVSKTNQHGVQHFFDKLLRIPDVLFTGSAKIEGGKRYRIMVDFLENLFKEHGADNWLEYLYDFGQK